MPTDNTQSASQARIKVRVQPRASRNEVVGYREDEVRLRVTSPPEAGRANEGVIALLSQALHIPKSRICILRGLSSRNKLVLVEGLTEGQIRRRIEAALSRSGI